MRADPVIPFLRTLRRLPSDVVLDIAGREIEPAENRACLCGWALRVGLGRAAGVDAEDVTDRNGGRFDLHDVPSKLAWLYGGTREGWARIYYGVTHDDRREVDGGPSELALIEAAMIARLFEVVNGGHA